MSRRRNLIGKEFGFLKVISFAYIKNEKTYWLCQCVCENKKSINGQSLVNGKTKSCGCKSRNMASDTMLSKLGVEHALQSGKIQEKIKGTCLKKYGTTHHSKNKEIKDKKIKTSLLHFGVKYPTQNNDIKEKTKQTNIKKYGVENPSQNNEIKEKIEQTCIDKYGVKNVMYVPEIMSRAARNQTISTVLYHWLSNKEIICQASYEVSVVENFNANKINYDWKPCAFKMPNGQEYTPDCYLSDIDKWIEIKGYFRNDAEEKWEWFHKEYPNSELWNEEKLKEMGIL